MKTVLQYLQERLRSEHEPIIRAVASEVRRQHYGKKPDRLAKYGDCTELSCKVADALRNKGYKSATVVSSTKHKDAPEAVRGASRKVGGHSWVEVPEVGHYVDPTHDQFVKTKRKAMPTVNGQFANHAVRVGKIGSIDHKKRYPGGEVDPDYVPNKKERLAYHHAELKKQPNMKKYMSMSGKEKKAWDKHRVLHVSAINKLNNTGY